MLSALKLVVNLNIDDDVINLLDEYGVENGLNIDSNLGMMASLVTDTGEGNMFSELKICD